MIDTEIIISILIVIFAWTLYRKIQGNYEEENNELDRTNSENSDMENLFFDEIRNGENPYKLIEINNQFDLLFIKSLFQSEQIPYYIDSENFSKIYPGLGMGFHILERDYADALQIINDFYRSKLKNVRINEYLSHRFNEHM